MTGSLLGKKELVEGHPSGRLAMREKDSFWCLLHQHTKQQNT